MPRDAGQTGAFAQLPTVSLRTAMLLRMVAVVAAVLGLITWLIVSLGLRPVTERMAQLAFEAAGAQVMARLDALQAGTQRALRAGQAWWHQAQPEVEDPTLFNSYFMPQLLAEPFFTSVVAGLDDGRGWMLLQLPEGQWRNRLTDVRRWGTLQWIEQRDGQGVVSRYPIEQAYDPRQRPWYGAAQALREPSEVAWTAPYRFMTTQEPGITASTVLTDERGQRLGVLGFDVRLQDLSEVTQSARVGQTGLAWLMSQEELMLGLPARPPTWAEADWARQVMQAAADVPLPPLQQALVAWQAQGRPAQAVLKFELEGQDWLASARPYAVGTQRWWVMAAAPAAEFMPDARRITWLVVAVWLALLAPLAWLARLQARSVVRPLEVMARESVRIGRLDFGAAEPVPPSHVREIEQLREAQERTRELLKAHQEELTRRIRELEQAQDAIHQLAYFDPLTRLPNRRLFIDRLELALARAQRSRRMGALLFIDLDNFKTLNDTLGHAAGDVLLQSVAERMVQSVRHTDTVSRFGGDEFLVMLEDLSPSDAADAQEARRAAQDEAGRLALKIQAAVLKPVPIGGQAFVCTCSIGVVLFDGGERAADLVKWADMAMYQAKAAGRDAVRFFDPAFQAQAEARMTLEAQLRRAIEAEELQMWLQPQFDAQRRVVGAEALLRWPHAQRGWVSPAEFIPVAEASGLIVELGQWVLRQACAQLARWAQDPLARGWTMSVNVSARQFRHPHFVASVRAVLAQSGAPAHRLRLELTESLLLEDVQQTVERMDALRREGVTFSLDDFGTGYSSLSYLKRLPFAELKIDQAFVRDLTHDANDAVLTRTMIALAHALGLVVLAEGVETAEQFEILAREGCDLFQGYGLGRPMPVAAFDAQLRAVAESPPVPGEGSQD